MNRSLRWSLWGRWILANSVGELVGLGATFAIGVGLFSGLAETAGVFPTILTAVLMTSAGALEGAVVGLAQWLAMHASLPQLPRWSWVRATIVGALIAWFFGSVPMTIASVSAAAPQEVAQEPPAGAVLLLASAMGLVAGLVLSLIQWRVLREHVEQAWQWLPANSIAWAAGMPIVFAAIDGAQRMPSLAGGIGVMVVSLAITGAVVGAIHGVVLVSLVGRHRAG
jgi:hypothetical protein